jgi:HEAT repeat protein
MKRYWYIWSFLLGIAGVVCVFRGNLSHGTGYHPDARDPDPAVRADAVRNGMLSVKQALHDENPDVRILAIWNTSGDRRSIVPYLKDENAAVRREAVKALWSESSWPVIKEGLADPDPRVRKGAIEAIFASRTHRYDDPWPLKKKNEIAQILLKMATDDPDAEVRLVAEEAHEDFIGWKR